MTQFNLCGWVTMDQRAIMSCGRPVLHPAGRAGHSAPRSISPSCFTGPQQTGAARSPTPPSSHQCARWCHLFGSQEPAPHGRDSQGGNAGAANNPADA